MPRSAQNARAKALANPVRANLCSRLRRDELSPKALAEQVGISIGRTAYHVRQLVDAGLVEETRTEPVRGALQHFYRAAEDGGNVTLNVRLSPARAEGLMAAIRTVVADYKEDEDGELLTVVVHR